MRAINSADIAVYHLCVQQHLSEKEMQDSAMRQLSGNTNGISECCQGLIILAFGYVVPWTRECSRLFQACIGGVLPFKAISTQNASTKGRQE